MIASVSNKIYVQDASREFIDWCRKELVLPNPEYAKKERMGLWLGNTPREIRLYERNGIDVVIPFGCLKTIYRLFPNTSFFNAIIVSKPVDFISCINLYPYQENAVQAALRAKNGVIVMPCGSGKTQTGLELIARLGVKTLWLTHTKDLLNQSMSRAKSVFGIAPEAYGTITDGKVDIGSAITFATVQTMSKLDLAQYRDTFGCVVVDECHKAVGSPTKVMQFYKVLSNLSCRYKFGLTATPERSDGLEKSMFALLGDIVFRVSQEEIDTTCPVSVRMVRTGYLPDMETALNADGTLNYNGLVEDMTHNEERFNLVLNIINLQYKAGAMLVLANRVEYLKRLNEEFEGRSICLSQMGWSQDAKEKRRKALRRLNEGQLDCIFATYQLAKEGLDVPNLRFVVFATPEKDPTTVTQSAGRVARKAYRKEKGVIIDFVDNFGMFSGWAKKRKAIYKKLGFILEE